MRYLSVCSGIEAATAAWHPMGWQPFAFSEIEKFPSRVLAHHYPNVPNLGDMTKFKEWPRGKIDLLVGGTPCQSFSVAGLRKGLDDPRGNLALTYCAILDRYKPRWFVWENVPGVLSSWSGATPPSDLEEGQEWEANETSDFGCLLDAFRQLGYGFAYRVLDAQFVRVDGFARAVPQRRRRVFVVGYLGDWRRAAAVLFERESLLWDTAPRRQAGEGVTPTIASRPTGGGRLGTDFDCDGGLIAKTLVSGGHSNNPLDENLVAHALRASGFDASEDGTGRGTPLVPIAFSAKDYGGDAEFGLSPTLRAGGFANSHANAGVMPAVAFDMRGSEGGSQFEGPHSTANIRAASGGSSRSYVAQTYAVRRLTPRECERLQGFPDDYTTIPKVADGPRYKALGNSMAVNVMRWIGRRIQLVEARHNVVDFSALRAALQSERDARAALEALRIRYAS